MTPSPPAFMPAVDAFALFFKQEVLVSQGFPLAKSSLYEAYALWAIEVPGRPPLSPKHIGMLVHKLAPGTGSGLYAHSVRLWVGGAHRDCRPFMWYGLRLLYPRPDDPFELDPLGNQIGSRRIRAKDFDPHEGMTKAEALAWAKDMAGD